MITLDDIKQRLVERLSVYEDILESCTSGEREYWWTYWYETIKAIESINQVNLKENNHG